MLTIIACLIIGILLALFSSFNVPAETSSYVAIAILAGLDSVFGGFASTINNNFKMKIFITGFFGNAILAAALTYMGKLLDVDIYLAAIIVFGTRLFQNFAIIRRYLLNKYMPDSIQKK